MDILGIFLFLIICGHRFWFVGATPRFTSWPNNKNPIYKKVGETAVFLWEFNLDGSTYSFGALKRKDSGNTIGRLPATGSGSVIGAGYRDRSSLTATDRSSNPIRITFRLTKIVRNDNAEYELEVHTSSNPAKGSAQLVVVVPPTITYKNPSGPDITITENGKQKLECAADGNPKPTLEWFRGSVLVETNRNVTLDPIKRQDAGDYRCRATVMADQRYDASFTIKVIVRYKPYIISGLSNQTVTEGNRVSFYCEAQGNPPSITYNWYKDNLKLSTLGNYEITSNGRSLIVKSAGKGDIDQYKCTGTNDIGEGDGSVGYLSVRYKPTLVTVLPYPEVTKEETDSVTLTCQADGVPPPSYKWEFNNQVITGEVRKNLIRNNLQKSNIGKYSCVATNAIGVTKNHTKLFVRYKPTTVNLTTGTPGNAVVQGTSVTLVCISDGYPEPTYTFKKGDTDLAKDSSSRAYTFPQSITLNDEGDYTCTPKNSKGGGPTATMTLTVQVKPNVITSIVQATKTENENFTYTCIATGKPPPDITWFKDGTKISQSSIYNIVQLVGAASTPKVFRSQGDLNMTRLTWRQGGKYVCLASNAAGNASSAAQLTIRHRPVVKIAADHPQNKTIREEEDAVFQCKMIGNPPLDGYLWQVNGRNVTTFKTERGISTLTVSEAKASDKGTYTCLGYNSLGYGPPANAYLRIKIIPVIVQWPEDDLIVNESSSVRMICQANGVPEPTYSWTKGDSQSLLAKGTILYIANTSYSDAGKYKCTASNEMGKDTKERKLVVQIKPRIFLDGPTVIFANSGTYITLNCSAEGNPLPNITWTHNGSDVSKQELSVTSENIIQSYIKFMSKRKELFGNYSCIASNSFGMDMRVITVYLNGTDVPTINSEKNNLNIYIGAAAGGGSLLLAIVVLVFFLMRRQRVTTGENVANRTCTGFSNGAAVDRRLDNYSLTVYPHDDNEAIDAASDLYDYPEDVNYNELFVNAHALANAENTPYEWEYPPERLHIEGVIGKGAFCQVAKAFSDDLGAVAVKMLKANSPESDRRDLLSEMELMKELKPHPNVVRLLGVITRSEPLMAIVEYIPYGDLLGYLRRSRGMSDNYYKNPDYKPKTSLTPHQLLKFAKQTADGMAFLSKNKIIHRDLAARNVLVGGGLTCKITDFGMARDVQGKDFYQKRTRGRLPVKWTAYEALCYGYYTTQSDVWSFGIVLYEIFTIGGCPYPNMDGHKIANMLQEGYRMEKPAHVDNDLYQMMCECWITEPERRPSFDALSKTLARLQSSHKQFLMMSKYDERIYGNVDDLC